MTAYFPKNPRSIHVFLTPFLRIETDPTARAIGSKLSPAVFSAVREKSFVLSGLKFEVQASLTVEAGCSQRFLVQSASRAHSSGVLVLLLRVLVWPALFDPWHFLHISW